MRSIARLLTVLVIIFTLMALACWPSVVAEPVQPGTVLYLPLVLSARPVSTPGARMPELVSPKNGIHVNSLAPELAWHGAADQWYGVEIATDPQFTALAMSEPPRSNCGGPDYKLMVMTNLQPATVYYWRVGYEDGTGGFTWSQIWSFTTPNAGGATPPAPMPALPAYGSTVDTLTPCLTWQGVDGASLYHVTLGVQNSLFSFNVLSPTPGQLVPFALLPNHVYAWRVRAFNGYGWGVESTTWLFQTPPY